MIDASLNATEIAVGSLLANRGYGGYGGAGCNTYANPSANAVRLERNAKENEILSDGNRMVLGEGLNAMRDQFDAATRNREFHDNQTQIAGMEQKLSDQGFRAELRTNDRLQALQQEMNENARRAAECCCDLKVQSCEDKAQILAAIAENDHRAVQRSLDNAQSRVNHLETINAITQACGCCTPRQTYVPCNPCSERGN